ncbi:hypothetical protein CERZMDRAFT_113946 [Cercospora zeae-maydis SCOH1-5]|uniref:Protein sip5 n=1 Tax=Cercospora zeae-maydis SCOH1-5 TaxID=717836 RepID=A0A6A6F833_9PEZI|nr:hypothetical protein CERZMDRAFT_113946 [Cercospora zeae-maydis SCOH1-5]
MGNSSSKDERKAARAAGDRQNAGATAASPQQAPTERSAGRVYVRGNGSASARGSSNNLSLLRIVRGERDEAESAQSDRPRETKQERDARRAEREKQARIKERERSMKEEHVDGGYLVTLGVYVGVEDFNKQVVRQLQIERRLAPFWKGLDDHSDSWTEAQLVAAVRGLPIPAADSVPAEMARSTSQASTDARSSEVNVNSLTVPITGRSQSYQSDQSSALSASHPTFSTNSGPSSPTGQGTSLLRGRAKTLASLASGNKSQSPDSTPQEVRLPNDPNVNGQPLEAYLYKDAVECPICFMYYPPYLNHTRCCDQPICSECFVQIKRPDPHPPEHEQPGQQRPPEEEAEQLVSEEAACPFCVTPQFGVTYEPPPFRRGLAYANPPHGSLRPHASAMSSSTSLQAQPGRRRATSLSANAPGVVTTDRVRPDWAKKLADARANLLRRSAAATALHNAAYVLNNQGDAGGRVGFAVGRRRRTLFGDSPSASGSGTPREGEGSDIAGGRTSSRRARVEDLEELMMMEAIRLSLQAEEERKAREEKQNAKEAKKKAKAEKKDEKKADKAAKKSGRSGSLYQVGTNDSSSSWAGTKETQGKGKQPAQDFAGFHPLTEPTSTLNQPASTPSTAESAQQHLEAQRARFESESSPVPAPMRPTHHLRDLSGVSGVSSAASSFVDSGANSNFSSHNGSGLDVSTGGAHMDGTAPRSGSSGAAGGEPMLNFQSLTAMIESDDKAHSQHVEHTDAPSPAAEQLKEPSPTGSPLPSPSLLPGGGNRSRGDSGESSSVAPPPSYVEPSQESEKHVDADAITPAPETIAVHDPDHKEPCSVQLMDHGHGHGHVGTT